MFGLHLHKDNILISSFSANSKTKTETPKKGIKTQFTFTLNLCRITTNTGFIWNEKTNRYFIRYVFCLSYRDYFRSMVLENVPVLLKANYELRFPVEIRVKFH